MNSSLFASRPFAVRITVALLILSTIIMWIDSKNPVWFSNLRAVTHSAMQPVYQFSTLPNFTFHWSESMLHNKEALRRENIQLQTQLIQAQAQLQKQDYILAENARLKGLLSTVPEQDVTYLLTQVIGTDTNPTRQILLLNKGKNDNVQVGQTVIDEHGVLGQIINVYRDTSRVLLISDEQQSVAVIVKRTGQRAIVTGNGQPEQLNLEYIFKSSDVEIGDELISSGLGQRFPAGYHVGTVTQIHDEQSDNFVSIQAKPSANLISNRFALILKDNRNIVLSLSESENVDSNLTTK